MGSLLKFPAIVVLLLIVPIALSGCTGESSENQQKDQAGGEAPSTATAIGQSSGRVPPVRVLPAELKFGPVAPGATVTGTVTLNNFSDQPVRILSVQPSCKCTTTQDLNGKVIPAKGSLELEASLESQSTAGGKTTNIKVLFEGFSQVLTIPLSADISRVVRSTPPYINAVGGGAGAPVPNESGTLLIDSLDGAPFSILSVQGRPPQFPGGGSDAGEAATSHRIRYDLRDHFGADGLLPRFLVVETDHPDAPVIEVMVRHKSVDLQLNRNFKVVDYKMNLGRVAPGGEVEHVFVAHEATTLGDLVMVTPQCPHVTVEITGQSVDEETDDLSATLRFRIAEDAPEGFQYFAVDLYTSSQLELALPAFVCIRK